jgi:biopolymer transport protein ExbD
MRTPAYRNRTDISENMMTSMIDVVFLLLIFFVCAAARAGGLLESLLPTNLAAGTIESASPIDTPSPLGDLTIKLRLDDAGAAAMELNGRVHSDFDSLRQTLLGLAKIAPEIPVVLHTEPDVPVRELIRVYDSCQAARFRDIRFATRQPPPSGKTRR